MPGGVARLKDLEDPHVAEELSLPLHAPLHQGQLPGQRGEIDDLKTRIRLPRQSLVPKAERILGWHQRILLRCSLTAIVSENAEMLD